MTGSNSEPTFTHQIAGRYAKQTLQPGIYSGVVVGNMLPNNSVDVGLEGQDTVVPCLWAAGIVSSLLGYKTSYTPPIGTKVIIYFTGKVPSLIIGSLPGSLVDPYDKDRRALDPDGPAYSNQQAFQSRNLHSSPLINGHSPPLDLVEGEIDMQNLNRVGLSLLRHIASIQAGDLAKVECHLLDDMVRIISDTFRHYTAFGDYTVQNDGGRLNVVWHGTSHEHEALGNLSVNDPKARMKDPNTVDMKDGVDGITDDGRWRFSQYVGWVGNFINLFVTDPVEQIGKLADDQLRSGKFRAHVNNDGSLLVQSVADIAFERVVRIPVPIPIRRTEDPAGNRSNEELHGQDYLKTWTPSNAVNLFEMVFQIRDYARWLGNAYSLGRFRQMNRDFRVPSEEETPEPKRDNGEPDKESVNTGAENWTLAYSTIRICRDGSVMTLDCYGNAFVSTQVGVQVSTPKDLYFQAGGSLHLVAGRDINISARKNLNLLASMEKIRIRAKTGLQMICTNGNAVLELVGSALFKLIGKVNFNDTVQIEKSGDTDINGIVAALRVEAVETQMLDEHPNHIFDGSPVVTSSSEKFTHQASYGDGRIYETLSQQMLRDEEIASSGVWNLNDDKLTVSSEDRGAPWPGNDKVSQIAANLASSDSLNEPSDKLNFKTKPTRMKSSPMDIRYQE